MKNLKQQLIRLGYESPELRDHLRPVLDTLTRVSSRRDEVNPKDIVKGDTFSIAGSRDKYHVLSEPRPSGFEDDVSMRVEVLDPMTGKTTTKELEFQGHLVLYRY